MSLRDLDWSRLERGLVVPMLLVSGCFGPSEAEFEAAVARNSCGPAGGLAVVISLTPAPVAGAQQAPLWVMINDASANLRPGRWALDGSYAAANWCGQGGGCADAESGSLRLGMVDLPHVITGTIDASFPGVGRVRGPFTAEWIAGSVFCI